jgi:predicted tellurium resistance membrane protein TerC
MKKKRLTIRIVTLGLSILSVIGIALLILNDDDARYTTYEIIAFSVGMAGMIMAVLEHLNSGKQERQIDRMSREIHDLIEEANEDSNDDRYIREKLKELSEKK